MPDFIESLKNIKEGSSTIKFANEILLTNLCTWYIVEWNPNWELGNIFTSITMGRIHFNNTVSYIYWWNWKKISEFERGRTVWQFIRF